MVDNADITSRIIAAIRARGSDAYTLRDAAHEASHALEYDLDDFSRGAVSKSQQTLDNVARIRSEILARAVEQLVCKACEVDCDTVEHWAFITCMEMESIKHREPMLESEMLISAINRMMTHPKAIYMSERILALGGSP